ncbi:unnamed protein product [Bursaphelenchus okinawaensis]|uniref:6-phosphogluconolactonase n=1 Tax=Bursaphelenchus okinawaensis TaxID=465554 RepID=A0A811LL30_9BILA|nr:unnamed protein product [Bursaphelenchus okinawaensis]CAG9125347.1 unnamed protein product [Bursaphelenchus okinawaensis]
MPNRKVHITSDASDLENGLSEVLKTAFSDYLARGDGKPFVIGFSGGSMPKTLIPVLKATIPSEKRGLVKLFPVDERLVPLEDPENNTNYYLQGLKDTFNDDQFAVVAKTGNETGEEATEQLNGLLKKWSDVSGGYPVLDILFLGMGPDGHTCSLFPGHQLLQSTKWTDVITDSPKPPSKRITVTLPLLNNARSVVFISTGGGKAQVLKEILDEDSNKYPAGLISLNNGQPVHYFLDKDAAEHLKPKGNL